MKYFAFAGEQYYPGGGIRDYIGEFSSTDEAFQYLKDYNKSHEYDEYSWGHIVDQNLQMIQEIDWFDLNTDESKELDD